MYTNPNCQTQYIKDNNLQRKLIFKKLFVPFEDNSYVAREKFNCLATISSSHGDILHRYLEVKECKKDGA